MHFPTQRAIITMTPKTQRHQKRKTTDQYNILYEFRCKNPQQSTTEPNAARCKKIRYHDKMDLLQKHRVVST